MSRPVRRHVSPKAREGGRQQNEDVAADAAVGYGERCGAQHSGELQGLAEKQAVGSMATTGCMPMLNSESGLRMLRM